MRKKLIEVALPLDEINAAAAREKSIRHGHPSTLHLWWARRPLAAARAMIFAQMIDDPSSRPSTTRSPVVARCRYAKVLDAAGNPMSVREALALINQILDEVLAEQEGDFDADSRWALAWFEQHGFDDGDYGDAETLSKAKNTSVAGMVEAGILKSRAGQVRLLRPRELRDDWEPGGDAWLTAWEMVHHLVRVLEAGGEVAAAERAAEALAYNGLVQSWPEISRLAAAGSTEQGALFGDAAGDAGEDV